MGYWSLKFKSGKKVVPWSMGSIHGSSSTDRSAGVREAPSKAVPRQSSAEPAPECSTWIGTHKQRCFTSELYIEENGVSPLSVLIKITWSCLNSPCQGLMQCFTMSGNTSITEMYSAMTRKVSYSKVTILSWKVFSLKIWCPSQVSWQLDYHFKGGSNIKSPLFIWVKSSSSNRWVNRNDFPRDLVESPPLNIFKMQLDRVLDNPI